MLTISFAPSHGRAVLLDLAPPRECTISGRQKAKSHLSSFARRSRALQMDGAFLLRHCCFLREAERGKHVECQFTASKLEDEEEKGRKREFRLYHVYRKAVQHCRKPSKLIESKFRPKPLSTSIPSPALLSLLLSLDSRLRSTRSKRWHHLPKSSAHPPSHPRTVSPAPPPLPKLLLLLPLPTRKR